MLSARMREWKTRTISTEMPAVAGSARSRRHTSNPLIRGIITSSSSRSGCHSPAAAMASVPV